MHVAITGATGMIGSALTRRLRAEGHQVSAISRSPRGPDTILWAPSEGRLDARSLVGVDAVVHLAGESIMSGRWTQKVKQRIRDSRVQGTDLLARTMVEAEDGPRVLVSASGINYYGDQGDAVLTEASPPGEGFLADVCREWEAATAPASDGGVRTTIVRIGIVQSTQGGALKAQLPLYRLALGGRLGSGDQWLPWIGIDDLVGVFVHALTHDDAPPVMNGTSPNPVRQAVYAQTLARVLGRPAALPVPAFGPRLVLGEMADELLFISARVLPEATQEAGYVYRQPTLDEALRTVLGRNAA